MKNTKPLPESFTIQLSNMRVVVSAPDYKLTTAQENEIAEWWRDLIDRDERRIQGLPDVD